MAAPIVLYTGGSGASGHNSAVATGRYTIAVASTQPLWIHLGFVPKLFFLVKDDNAAADRLYVWGEGMADGSSKVQAAANWLLDVNDGITPINNLLVTSGDYYIRTGPLDAVTASTTVHRSTGSATDYIIGVEIGVAGHATINIAGTYYYAAIR